MSDDEKFLQRCETSPLRSEAIEILCRMIRERDIKLKEGMEAGNALLCALKDDSVDPSMSTNIHDAWQRLWRFCWGQK